jgi:hypothetical protein
VVAGGGVAGPFDSVGVMPGPADDAGVGAVPPGKVPRRVCTVIGPVAGSLTLGAYLGFPLPSRKVRLSQRP